MAEDNAYLAKLTSTKAEPSRIAGVRVLAHRQLRSARDDGWDLSPLAEYIEALESNITAIEAERDFHKSNHEAHHAMWVSAEKELKRAEADRDRLRGALENIADVKQGRMEPPSELIRRIKVYACAALNPSKPGEG